LLSPNHHVGYAAKTYRERGVPTLFRFLFVVGVLAALVYGAMLALVTFVQPQPREMTQTVPASKLNK
jgi:hypothetical protein